MLLGVGVDLLNLLRLREMLSRREPARLAARILSDEERAQWNDLAASPEQSERSLALRCVAKEQILSKARRSRVCTMQVDRQRSSLQSTLPGSRPEVGGPHRLEARPETGLVVVVLFSQLCPPAVGRSASGPPASQRVARRRLDGRLRRRGVTRQEDLTDHFIDFRLVRGPTTSRLGPCRSIVALHGRQGQCGNQVHSPEDNGGIGTRSRTTSPSG